MACRRHHSGQSVEGGVKPETLAADQQRQILADASALMGFRSTLKDALLADVRLTSQFGKPQSFGTGLYGFVAA